MPLKVILGQYGLASRSVVSVVKPSIITQIKQICTHYPTNFEIVLKMVYNDILLLKSIWKLYKHSYNKYLMVKFSLNHTSLQKLWRYFITNFQNRKSVNHDQYYSTIQIFSLLCN